MVSDWACQRYGLFCCEVWPCNVSWKRIWACTALCWSAAWRSWKRLIIYLFLCMQKYFQGRMSASNRTCKMMKLRKLYIVLNRVCYMIPFCSISDNALYSFYFFQSFVFSPFLVKSFSFLPAFCASTWILVTCWRCPNHLNQSCYVLTLISVPFFFLFFVGHIGQAGLLELSILTMDPPQLKLHWRWHSVNIYLIMESFWIMKRGS